MNNIDDSLRINEMYSIFQNNSYGLNATKDNLRYGELFLPFCSVIIHDQKDFDEFERVLDLKYTDIHTKLSTKEERIFKQRMQLYAHEYFHFFQLLSLPTMKYQALVEKRKLELEATVVLKYIDQCKKNNVVPAIKNIEYQGLLSLVDKLDKYSDLHNLKKSIKAFNEYAIYYTKVWVYEEKGISLIGLIESMAHIYSQYVTQSEDVLNLEQNNMYIMPYKYYLSCFNSEEVDLSTRHLLFLYLGFFATKNYNTYGDEHPSRAVMTFIELCSSINLFLKYLSNRKQYYSYYSREDFKEVFEGKLIFPKQLFDYATDEQVGSLAAFFETILLIQDNASKFKTDEPVSESLKDYNLCTRGAVKYNIDVENIYTLANLSVFPANFAYLMDAHEYVMTYVDKGLKYNREKEAEFHSMIKNCNNLLNSQTEIKCCEEHGFLSDKKSIRNCTNDDSFAILIKDFLKMDIKDIFWIY